MHDGNACSSHFIMLCCHVWHFCHRDPAELTISLHPCLIPKVIWHEKIRIVHFHNLITLFFCFVSMAETHRNKIVFPNSFVQPASRYCSHKPRLAFTPNFLSLTPCCHLTPIITLSLLRFRTTGCSYSIYVCQIYMSVQCALKCILRCVWVLAHLVCIYIKVNHWGGLTRSGVPVSVRPVPCNNSCRRLLKGKPEFELCNASDVNK